MPGQGWGGEQSSEYNLTAFFCGTYDTVKVPVVKRFVVCVVVESGR